MRLPALLVLLLLVRGAPFLLAQGPVRWTAIRWNGTVDLFTFGASTPSVRYRSQMTDDDPCWTGWFDLGRPSQAPPRSIAARAGQKGRELLFAAYGDRVFLSVRPAPGKWFGKFQDFGVPNPSHSIDGLDVTENQDGRIEVFVAAGGIVLRRFETRPGGPWSGWRRRLGAPSAGPVTGLAVARNADGRLEVFTVVNGRLHSNPQVQAGGNFKAWARIGRPGTRALAAPYTFLTEHGGRIRGFLVAAGEVWTVRQPAKSSGTWAWQSLGKPATGTPHQLLARKNKDGRIELIARRGREAWHLWQIRTGGFSAWSRFATPTMDRADDLAVSRNFDGRLVVLARHGELDMSATEQTIPSGPWVRWWPLPAPSMTIVPDRPDRHGRAMSRAVKLSRVFCARGRFYTYSSFRVDGSKTWSPWYGIGSPPSTIPWTLPANSGTHTIHYRYAEHIFTRIYLVGASGSAQIYFYRPPEAFGKACSGSRGEPFFSVAGLARLGGRTELSVRYPLGVRAVFVGASDTTWNGQKLPFELLLLGAPGCFANVSLDFGAPGPIQLTIPNDPRLADRTFYAQGFVLGDPAAPLLTTKGVRVHVAGH